MGTMRKEIIGSVFCMAAFAMSAMGQTLLAPGVYSSSGPVVQVGDSQYGMSSFEDRLYLWDAGGGVQTSDSLQIGSANSGSNKISIPGLYNFENVYLGQYGNGNSALEFINHTNLSNSYGVRLAANVDTGGAALQFQVAPSAASYSALSYSTAMVINTAGNVGVGTSSPGERLEVSGNLKLSGSGSHIHFVDGTDQSTAWTGTLTGGDYAESVDVTGDRDQYEPGDVLVVDADHPGHFLKAAECYSMAVTGVYSTKPGVVGRRQKIAKALTTSEVPMAMVGIVPTKVTAENGPIKPGDVLVTSSRPGYAMKGTDRSLLAGAVIGKALAPLEYGTGLIEAVISLQ